MEIETFMAVPFEKGDLTVSPVNTKVQQFVDSYQDLSSRTNLCSQMFLAVIHHVFWLIVLDLCEGVEVNKPSYRLYCWIFSVKFLHVLELVIHKLYLARLVCISDPCIPNSFVGYIGDM